MSSDEVTEYFQAISRDLLRMDTAAAMDELVLAAVKVVDGCEHASLSYLDGRELRSAASNDDIGPTLDRLQTECQEGPCMDATRHGGRYVTDDLRTDHRWPAYGPRAAAETGVLSSAAISLHDATRNVGALNLFSSRTATFDPDLGQDAVIAVVAPFCATVLVGSTNRANLERALLTRDLIGQAKGMLMAQSHIDADTAFDLLRSASQRMNVKVADVAQRIVDGTLHDSDS